MWYGITIYTWPPFWKSVITDFHTIHFLIIDSAMTGRGFWLANRKSMCPHTTNYGFANTVHGQMEVTEDKHYCCMLKCYLACSTFNPKLSFPHNFNNFVIGGSENSTDFGNRECFVTYLRFGFGWPLCAFTNYIYLYLLTYFQFKVPTRK